MEETLETLAKLVARGVIHQVGWSNVIAWQFQKIVSTAEVRNLPRPVTLQPRSNLLDRGDRDRDRVLLSRRGQFAHALVAPRQGLAHRQVYGRRAPEGATRLGENPARGVEAYDLGHTDRICRILTAVQEISAAHGRPKSHAALAWLLQRPGVGSALPGALTPRARRPAAISLRPRWGRAPWIGSLAPDPRPAEIARADRRTGIGPNQPPSGAPGIAERG
ncbi:Aldo/keto reductase family protein [Jannaschia seohaensis]|uniref:Aldo/keto reductase family protein n=1 Tax=Jannaschia seohaensis TaxID=475081 RepID=A0A2Y9ALT9_9RHOB|nr:aldo/keto reductase family protein [Jannaschia seohaensis]SSA44288.1 Aldo/keto reductase family protein [Jannaschia seohaensis]